MNDYGNVLKVIDREIDFHLARTKYSKELKPMTEIQKEYNKGFVSGLRQIKYIVKQMIKEEKEG